MESCPAPIGNASSSCSSAWSRSASRRLKMLDDPSDTNRLERRLRAVVSVRQAVQLIWLLARSQLPDVETAADSASEYVEWIESTVGHLARPPHGVPTTVASSIHVLEQGAGRSGPVPIGSPIANTSTTEAGSLFDRRLRTNSNL